ncbi:tRNA (N(6)-L-threonylcarbamoyladenosine(37)-C(2))-methylthiotransferase MtaB [Faecalibacterium sp. An121]|uniref:tRNA (N(6)-L-threonylcarbamoyladenosine(37)-C(2))- methylthiotransferase MtaB n=1 Tax=Faecalibacterium sp. An121 TaxID=1965550 RepID=UPI000B37C922|nr:tRNA (N(6)-L-threonylcarbamoyladenosine(37)-C(2))-methylthiotransferase MtaB [Faecalibacterium sp. An121]OUQ36790.1 tRNA (N(6)-L-threonylcarbamoyladenosine(37)-C(2))-methylthiotransferase MtaB [Faecalibacterium sp. An121]
MRVCFYTLGCKVNLNETEALEQLFRRSGFTVVPDGQPADVYIVNSCTVTNFGDQKSRKWLRHAKRENPGAVTVLTGCYPQAFPEQAAGLLEADLVCGNTDRRAILDHVMQLLNGHERIVAVTPHTRGEAFEEMPVDRFETHTRAFIKVEDGCNRRCAYCIIPKARGPVRSRPISSILAELRQLAGAGYREVVLSAISLPSYGTDTGTDLYELVEQCAGVEGIQRIRLGSLDPDMLTPEGIRRLAAVDKLCPQFHLSLQSGCDATLRRMRRPYTTAQYLDVVRQLRQAYAGRPVSFTTDCICGFPGESEEDFVRSCGFLEEVGFLRVHVFPYSRREGTPAYDFPQQVHEREKQARSRRMHDRAEEVRRAVLAGLEGSEDQVLLETPVSATVFTGYTRLYVPVSVSAPGCAAGDIVRVRLGRYDGARVQAAFLGRV